MVVALRGLRHYRVEIPKQSPVQDAGLLSCILTQGEIASPLLVSIGFAPDQQRLAMTVLFLQGRAVFVQ